MDWLRGHFKDRSRRSWVLAGSGAILITAIVLAIQSIKPGVAENLPATHQPFTFGLAVDVTIKLGLVLMLIYGCVYALRNWQRRSRINLNRQMAVLETLHLTPRQSLHLVKAGARLLLIGATDQTLTHLAEIELQATELSPVGEEPQDLFSSILERTLKHG
jgi:flagellar biosynthetic protein FliO